MDTAERARIAAEAEYDTVEKCEEASWEWASCNGQNEDRRFGYEVALRNVASQQEAQLMEKDRVIERLLALAQYADHKRDCPKAWHRPKTPHNCTCGFDAHLSTLRAEIEPPTTTK